MPEGDPLPPGDDPARGPSTLICEFCDCKISRAGEVIKLGAKAKVFRDSDSAIEKLTETVSKRDEQIAQLKSDLEAARAVKPADVEKPGRSGFLSND